ncbi:MAG: STAS domain-containing protein [Gammaproteobacteria bacterium]|nr:STAS domain-containing protein [Gammaproteobacteria bacterium]
MTRIDGDLDLAAVPHWLARADELAGSDTLDLAGVRRVDSAGISLLLELSRRARASGRALALTRAPQRLRTLANFLGIGSLLSFD